MSATRSALDVSTTARTPARRRSGEQRASDLRHAEHSLELVTFPLADLAAPSDAMLVAEAIEQCVEVEDVRPRERHDVLCRAMNITLAVVALVALSPLFLLIALAVKLTSRGPILFRQRRGDVHRRGSVEHAARGERAGG